MKLSDNLICFNNNNKKINIEELDFNNYVDIFFEINYIIYDDNSNSFQIIYNAKQIKENILFDMLESVFTEKPKEVIPVYSVPNIGPPNILPQMQVGPPNMLPIMPPNIPPIMPSKIPQQTMPVQAKPTPAPVARLVLTPSDLLAQINKLKKKQEDNSEKRIY
jgi:hypothetical protein